MAPRAKLTAKDDAEDDVIDITPNTFGPETDPVEQIAKEFDAGSDSQHISARVFRVVGSLRSGATLPFLFEFTEYDSEHIQERLLREHGTGTYLVRIFCNRQLVKAITYSVEAPITPPEPKGSDMAEVLKAIQASNEAMWARMESTLAQRVQAPVIDPMAMLEKMTGVMRNLNGMHPGGAPAPQGPSMDAVFGLVERGMEIGQRMSGGGDGDSIIGMVKDVVVEVAKQPAFAAMLAGFLNRGAPPQIQDQPALQPPAEPGVPPNATDAQKEFARTLTYLVDKAQHGKDVALYVDWFLDQYAPEFTQQLFANPQLLDQLSAIHPGVAQQREWFGRFIDLARTPAQGGQDGDGTPEDDAPDDGHANPTDGNA